MKIREGFVSNSSSSSFTCDVTGDTESGYNASAGDCGMLECVNDHTFVEGYKVNDVPYISRDDRMQMIRDSQGKSYNPADWEHLDDIELEDAWRDSTDGQVREIECPICSFKNVKQADAYKYLMADRGFTEEMLLRELKNKFKNYGAYKKHIESIKAKIKSSR